MAVKYRRLLELLKSGGVRRERGCGAETRCISLKPNV